MKIRKYLICLLSLLFIMSGCTNTDKESDAMKFKNEYESLNGTIREKDGKTIRTITVDEDNPIVYITEDKIIEKMNNKDSFAIYFGFNDCPWCRSIVPTLIQVSKDLKLNQVFYCDVKNIRDTYELDDNNHPVQTNPGSENYPELLKKLDSVLEDYTLTDDNENEIQTGEKRIFAPNIIVIVNGKPKAMTSGNSELQTDGYMELSDDILNDSYKMIEDVLKILQQGNACEVETKC